MIIVGMDVIMGILIAAIVYLGYRSQKARIEWHSYETTAGPVMRRRVAGNYETRPMTPDEQGEYMASRCGW